MSKRWQRSDAVVSQRINSYQVGGFLSKKIQVMDGESAFLEENGNVIESFGEGDHKVGGLFSSSGNDITFVDLGEKKLRREIKGLFTDDDKKIIASIIIELMVAEADKIVKTMMKNKDVITLEDIWLDIENIVKSRILAPAVKKKRVNRIIGERKTIKEIQVAAEVELKKKFEVYGIRLNSFEVEFILPDDYQEYLRKRGEEKASEDEETKKALHKREMGKIDGSAQTREGALDRMEQERIKREAELSIEEEETQQDMKDAMQALKIKELKDKEKMHKESERKGMGLDSLYKEFPSQKKKMNERYNELSDMMEATQKKYFNRKIDKKTFNELFKKYEQEKTEIEVKLKKKGNDKDG